MSKKWYIVQTHSGREKQVMRSIQERVKLNNLEDLFGEVLVPTEEVIEIKNGKKYKSERKFFPGYVLVQVDMTEKAWYMIKNTPRVIGFLDGGGKPHPISDKEADAIFQRIDEGAETPKPKVLFSPGESVRVVDGPFSDFNGVVESVNYEKNRLRVAVMIFGRSTPVELEFSQVEKAQ